MADLLNLHPEMSRRLDVLLTWFRLLGYRPIVTSGYRSTAEQAQLHRSFARGERRLPAAEPGFSTHNFGLAVDVVVPEAPAAIMVAVGRASGLVWAGRRDPVHFDPFGFALWRRILRG